MSPVSLVLVVILTLPAVVGGTSARQQCMQGCQSTYEDDSEACDLDDCGDCLDTLVNSREACLGALDCQTVCQRPPGNGQCSATIECLDGCRARRSACWERFQHRVRRQCPCAVPCYATARKDRTSCRRSCQRGAPSVAGSPSPARAPGHGAADLSCGQVCLQNARRCSTPILASCFEFCAHDCDGRSADAEAICQQGCRNAKCSQLMQECTDIDSSTSAYGRCCASCEDCEAIDNCTVHTTTTLATTTTTTVTTTTITTTTTLLLG